ncbi:uncharacterized protein METZ01_LOCUS260092, partial [marine metagenome]
MIPSEKVTEPLAIIPGWVTGDTVT